MSCWTRLLFLSAMARAVSRRASGAQFDENSKLKSKSVGVLMFVFVVVVGVRVGVVVVEGLGCC